MIKRTPKVPAMPTTTPATASTAVSRSTTLTIVSFGSAHRFQNADLARALQHRRIHRLEDHQEADDDRDAGDHIERDD